MPKTRSRKIFKRLREWMMRKNEQRDAYRHKERVFINEHYPHTFRGRIRFPETLANSSNRRKRFWRALEERVRLGTANEKDLSLVQERA